MNTVLLITNQDDIRSLLEKNLVLLRASDTIMSCGYEEAPDVVYDKKPDIVIIHEHDSKDKVLNIVRYLKEKRVFENINIILLLDSYNRDFILNAYDEGIDDYITVNSDPSEMLIHTINCIKKSEKNKEIKNLKYYLGCYGIISEQSGFFSPRFAQEIFGFELINNDFSNGSFVLLTPDEDGKKEFSESKMSFAIQKSLRSGDCAAEYSGSKYGLLLKTDISGAIVVIDKIKSFLPEGLTIKAGISKITTRKFSEVEKQASCALNSALLKNEDYVIYSTSEQNNDVWFADEQSSEKSYKFFKSAYNKKLENVIAPVFYRLQRTYEDKFINTKIEQFTGETESVFRLINLHNEARLKIVSPGFSKVVICITYSGLDSPENREYSIPLNQINNKQISDIVEGFIHEFVDFVNKEKV